MVVLLTWYNPNKRMTYIRFYTDSILLQPLLFKNSYGHIVISRYVIKNGSFQNLDSVNDLSGCSSDLISVILTERKRNRDLKRIKRER